MAAFPPIADIPWMDWRMLSATRALTLAPAPRLRPPITATDLRKVDAGSIISTNKVGGSSMSAFSRRNFLSLAGSAAAASMTGRFADPARAAMTPTDKFDLVIKGGDVLDPSQSFRGKRMMSASDGALSKQLRRIFRPRVRREQSMPAGSSLRQVWSIFTVTSIRMAPPSAFQPTSWSSASALPPLFRRAMPASTIWRRCAATLWRSHGRVFMPSSTSPTMGFPLFQLPNSTTSTMHKLTPAPWLWPRTPIS